MSKSILDEAMEDAKLLKETAIENAKNVLVEAISPKIKEFVDGQMGAPVVEMEDEPLDLGLGDEVEEEGMYEAKDEDEDEDKETCEAKDLDEGEEVVEITQEDLKQAFSEVLGDVTNEATVTSGFGDVEDPTPKTAGGKQQTGIADEKSGESHWKDETPPDAEDWTVKEVAYKNKIKKLSTGVQQLQKENNEYKKVVSFLKRSLQEVNVFNSKLLHTNKLMQNTNLNNKQRLAVIEAFDKAESMREVELVYKSLSESLKIAGVLSESKKPVRGKAGRVTKPSGTSEVLNESANKTEAYSTRLQELAGLIE